MRKAFPEEMGSLSWGETERVITHTLVPCEKQFYFLAGLRDTPWLLRGALPSWPELQLNLLWTLSTLSHNCLARPITVCLLEHLFTASTIPFSDVELGAWTAAGRAPAGLRVCLSRWPIYRA